MSRKYTKAEKEKLKDYKEKASLVSKSEDAAMKGTYGFIAYGVPILNVIVATGVCGYILFAIPDVLHNWADDLSSYNTLIWSIYTALFVVWVGYIYFPIKRIIRRIKGKDEPTNDKRWMPW